MYSILEAGRDIAAFWVNTQEAKHDCEYVHRKEVDYSYKHAEEVEINKAVVNLV